jgi:hypothetical protein
MPIGACNLTTFLKIFPKRSPRLAAPAPPKLFVAAICLWYNDTNEAV